MNRDEAVQDVRAWLDQRALPGHYSNILVEQLADGQFARTISTFAVLDEIGKLQGTWRGSPPKKPEQFKNKPLAGLWKQHYFQLSFMIKNLKNEISSAASKEAIKKICNSTNSSKPFGEGLHELIIGGFERRASGGVLTGEWIVFARDSAGRNFFLTLANHSECTQYESEPKLDWQRRSDAVIYERVAACRPEFPNLIL